jgi:heat shock protein HtpX
MRAFESILKEPKSMMRILLFLATNAAILVVISVVFRLLGIDSLLLESGGLDMGAL